MQNSKSPTKPYIFSPKSPTTTSSQVEHAANATEPDKGNNREIMDMQPAAKQRIDELEVSVTKLTER
jgi:hypothetical protein